MLIYLKNSIKMSRREKPRSWFDGWFGDGSSKESIKSPEIMSNLSPEEKEIINTIIGYVNGERFYYPEDVNKIEKTHRYMSNDNPLIKTFTFTLKVHNCQSCLYTAKV